MKKTICLFFLILSNCIGLDEKKLFDPSSGFGLVIQSNLCAYLKICPPRKPISETSRELTSFLFSVPPVFGLISDSKVSVVVPFFTNRTRLKAGFTHNGSRVDINGVTQETGITENNFTGIQKYRITARDGNSKIYDVEVKNASSNSKELMSFGFVNPEVTGFITGNINSSNAIKITVGVPFGTNVSNLVARFTITGNSINIAGASQTSGVTGNNFSSPVTYTVVAADGTTKTYEVTVVVGGTDSKDILSFGFLSLGVTGTITGTNINLTLPAGISAFNQIPFFTTNGKTVKVSGNVQISNSTAIDFSSAVIYTVEANDGSTKNYTVNVSLSTGSDKEMISFSIPSAGASSTISTSASSGTINLRVSPDSDLTNTVASFQITGVNVYINEREQLSGQTFNNFSNPPTYTIIAQDGSRKNFIVVISETLTITISGLTANGLSLFNGVTTTSIQAGQTSVSMGLDSSNGNRVSITAQPTGQVCAFSGNSAGILSEANPSSLVINCINGFLYAGKILPYDPATRQPMDTTVNNLFPIAGVGSAGSADNTNGLSALFNNPIDIELLGNFAYVTDLGSHTIRRIELTSPFSVTTIAGQAGSSGTADGIGLAARFNNPHGITTDGANLFITDFSNHSIRKLDLSNNEVTTIAGTNGVSGFADGIGAAARFTQPSYSTYHDGNLYITDTNQTVAGAGKIRKLSLATRTVTTLATGLSDPRGITNDGTNIYFADTLNHVIKSISIATGVITSIAGSGTPASYDAIRTTAHLQQPYGLDIEGNNLYFLEVITRKFRKINLTTNRVETFFVGLQGNTGGDTFAGTMCNNTVDVSDCPTNFTVRGNSIFLADRFSHRIFELKPANNYRYYPLAGNANEATNTGFNGTLQGIPAPTPARNHNGVAGGALRFDGTTNFVQASDSGLPTANFPRTMCAWIHSEDLPASNQYSVIASYGSAGNNSLLSLFNDGGTQNLSFGSLIGGSCSAATQGCGAVTIPLNTWVHVCGKLNTSVVSVYFNGFEVVDNGVSAKSSFTTSLIGATGLNIGRRSAGGSNFKGKIADVRIYDRALDDREVLILATNIPEGLVAAHSFTGNTLMAAENDHWFNRIALLNNASPPLTSDRFGQPNSAVSFDGINQFFRATNNIDNILPAGASPRTLCSWIRPTAAPLDNSYRINFNYGTGTGGEYCQGLFDLDPSASVKSGLTNCTANGFIDLNSPYEVNGVSAIFNSNGQPWHHICHTYDGNLMLAYINGSFINSRSEILNTVVSGTNYIIGAINSFGSLKFQGQVDDIRIYNRVLSLAEIRTLASPTKRMFLTNSTTAGLGGITGMDNICNNDTFRPDTEKTYKALIVDGTNRRACSTANCTATSENIDWVLKPNTTYYQPYATNSLLNNPRSYPIFSTTGIVTPTLPGTLLNTMNTAISTGGTYVRTGFLGPSANWTTNGTASQDTCFGWSSNNPVDNSRVGLWGGSSTSISDIRGIIDAGQRGCHFAERLICVEQ